MSSLSNTAAPVQDTVTDLASYRRLLDALTDADYTGTGVGLQRRSRGATRASDEMVITIDGEALVAYRAVAAQAATEANQIRLDAALAAQGAALHVANEIANNGWCALTAEPVVDQVDQADRARTWGNDTPTWGWGNVGTTAADWGSANDDAHDPWAPASPPTLSSISNDVGYTRDAISRLSLELGTVRSELRYARVCASLQCHHAFSNSRGIARLLSSGTRPDHQQSVAYHHGEYAVRAADSDGADVTGQSE